MALQILPLFEAVLLMIAFVESKKKTTVSPPVPKWSTWGPWDEACSTTCGIGVRRRNRVCIQPSRPTKKKFLKVFKAELIKSCPGSQSSQSKNCDTGITCPINGGWSTWQSWECTVTCGGGTGLKKRVCDNPKPKFKGHKCKGPDEQKGPCNENLCPDQIYTLSPKAKQSLEETISKIHLNFYKKEGEIVRLPCQADVIGRIYEDYPRAKLYWTFNGQLIEIRQNVMDMTENELVLRNLVANNSGVYVCRINYAKGVDKPISVFALTVLPRHASMTTHVGSNFSLDCNGKYLQDIYPDLTQKWMHNDVLFKELQNNTDTLQIDKATKNMTGIWSCEVADQKTDRSWTTNMVRLSVQPTVPLYRKLLSNRNFLLLVFIAFFLALVFVGTYFSYVITNTTQEVGNELYKWRYVYRKLMDEMDGQAVDWTRFEKKKRKKHRKDESSEDDQD